MKHAGYDDVSVIDFGAHFYPEDPVKRDKQVDQYAGVDRLGNTETVRSEMETAGVDAMVYSNPDYLGHPDAGKTARANDALYEYVEEYDEFYGLAAIPLGNGEEAAAEFERAIEMGFHGGGLRETDVHLTDEELTPVLEVADRTGAPIFVHSPSLPSVEHRHNAVFGREHAQQESISRVIHDGTFDRYPDLDLVWHHLGGNIASMMGRIHLHTDPGRWPNQQSVQSYEQFRSTLEERVYVDTAGYFGYTAPIRVALEEFPSTQLLFGTDYPWEARTGEEFGRLVDAVIESGSRKDAERILGRNALGLMINVD